jgi:peptide/nickel transport system substrate-binding protein
MSDTTETINRRRLIQAIGTASAVGLAGCGGGGGGDGGSSSGDLGERVPEVTNEYWSDYGGFTTIQENMSAIIERNADDVLGVSIDSVGKGINTQLDETFNDERNAEITFFWYVNGFYRLDPQELTRWFAADNAGANGRANVANWANCEYTEAALAQESAPTEDQRREDVYQSQEIISDACVPIALTPNVDIGAWRTDEIEAQGIDDAGVTRTNANFFIEMESLTDRERIGIGVDPIMFETRNYLTQTAGNPSAPWEVQLHSPLLWYNESYELENYLAESYEVTEEGERITFQILDDATFHNGDPVTAEDVKFTFEQLVRGAEAGVYPKPSLPPYESINAVDEKTVEFNFSEPYLLFLSAIAPRWGILHKETWEAGGAVENPGGFEFENVVGSGPYQFVDSEAGSYMEWEPYEDHPVDVPDKNLYWRAYRDETTMIEALDNNEIQVLPEVSPGGASRTSEMSDVEAYYADGFLSFVLYPQASFAPGKFEAFRKALAASIDRQQLSDIAYQGEADPELYANHFMPSHPWRAPDDRLYQMADDPTGSPEMATSILEDAGWGWDSDGNLHYPPDADLSPVWPQGEEPSAEDFPCLSDV